MSADRTRINITDAEIRAALRLVPYTDWPRIFVDDLSNVARAGKHMTIYEVVTTVEPQFLLVLSDRPRPTAMELRDAFEDPDSLLIGFKKVEAQRTQ